ncbi:MAG: hypothetical protein ABEH65_07760 [Halobacteriales archaeon]
MGCPRCDGPVENYTLRGREASNCVRCGWVGIDATLRERQENPSTDSWDEALARVSKGQVTTERSETTFPGKGESANDGSREDRRQAPPTAADDAASGPETEPSADQLLEFDAIDEPEARELQRVGVRSIDELASIDHTDVAADLDVPTDRLRDLSERAAISLITDGAVER